MGKPCTVHNTRLADAHAPACQEETGAGGTVSNHYTHLVYAAHVPAHVGCCQRVWQRGERIQQQPPAADVGPRLHQQLHQRLQVLGRHVAAGAHMEQACIADVALVGIDCLWVHFGDQQQQRPGLVPAQQTSSSIARSCPSRSSSAIDFQPRSPLQVACTSQHPERHPLSELSYMHAVASTGAGRLQVQQPQC
jgi:hypothetical protein